MIVHISDTASVLVNGFVAPVGTMPNTFQTCAGSPVTIGGPATGGLAPYTYTWDMGISATTPTVVFTPTVTSVVTQTITDANGCRALGQFVVNAVVADAGPDKGICAGAPVIIGTPSSGFTGMAYAWTPTTGLISATNIAQPTANPLVNTTYTLTQTITKTNSGGGSATCVVTDQVVVTPVAAPNPGFAGPDQTICFGLGVTLGADAQFVNIGSPSSTNATQFSAVSQSTVNLLLGTAANIADATTGTGARTTAVPAPTAFVNVLQSSAGTSGTVANLTDGNAATGAITTAGTVGQWVNIDLGVNKFIGGLQLARVTGTGAGYIYQYCTDNSNWQDIDLTTPALTATLSTFAFSSPVFGRYIRIKNEGNINGVSLAEVRVLEAQWVQLDFGLLTTNITSVRASAVAANSLNGAELWSSTDGNTWTNTGLSFGTSAAGTFQTLTPATAIDVVRYFRIVKVNSGALDLAEFSATQFFKYTWAPGDYLSANTIAEPTYNAGNIYFTPTPDPSTYTVTATKNGCVFSDQTVVSVIRADAGLDGCGPRIIGGRTDAPNLNETFSWIIVSGTGRFLPGNTTTSNLPNPTVTAGTGPTQYRLTTTLNSISCATDDVLVPFCGCNFLIATIAPHGCPSLALGPVTLVADGANDANFTYSWSPAIGLSAYTGSTVQLTDNLARTYTVTKTSRIDPAFTCSQTINVNQPNMVEPVFTAVTATKCPGSFIDIGAPTVVGYNYLWQGQNLSANTTSSPRYTIPATASGLQTFPVRVTDNGTGCIKNDTAKITVQPTIVNAGPDWSSCSAGIIQLGTPALPGYTYSWSPNSTWLNGTTQTSAQPEVTVASNLTYTLRGTNTATGCFIDDQVNITISPNPLLPNAPDVSLCRGSSVLIGPANANSSYNYIWTPATGLSSTNTAQTIASPIANTTYRLTASFKTPGCSTTSSDLVAVTVSDPSFTLAPQTYCPSTGAVSLTGAPAGMSIYSWTPANLLANAAIQTPSTINPAPSTPTTFTLTVTNAAGCSASASKTITPTQTAPNAGGNKTICLGTTTELGSAANPTTGVTYTWTPSTGLSSATSGNPTFTPPGTGIYTFRLSKTTTATSCTSVDDVTIVVNGYDLPELGSTTICNGAPAQLGTTAEDGTSYLWSPGTGLSSTTISNPISTATSSIIYRLTAIGANGCADTVFVPLIVSAGPAPQITMASQNICVGGATTTTFNPSVSPAGTYTYSWAPNNGLLSSTTVLNPTVTMGNIGATNYTLTATDLNGCTGSATAAINLQICPSSIDISGKVVNDANNSTSILDGSETGTSAGANLYVYLVNGSGVITDSAKVAANGTYTLQGAPNTVYTLELSAVAYAIGTTGVTVVTIDNTLPSGWVTTGEGANNTDDGTPNGVLGLTTGTSNISNVNFGIERRPETNNQLLNITKNVEVGKIYSFPSLIDFSNDPAVPQLSGSDPEDKPVSATDSISTGGTFVITTLPPAAQAALYYNGTPLGAGVIITNYDPAKLQIEFKSGTMTTSFQYATRDAAGMSDLSPATYQINLLGILPVTGLRLNASQANGKVALQWETISETNTAYFDIGQSRDGVGFAAMGRVTAAGNSNTVQKYGFTSPMPGQDQTYYRVTLYDKDGKRSYSNIVRLSISNLITLFPNPTSHSTTISGLTGKSTIHVLNADGRLMQSITTANASQTIYTNKLAEGIYLVKLLQNGQLKNIFKLIKE